MQVLLAERMCNFQVKGYHIAESAFLAKLACRRRVLTIATVVWFISVLKMISVFNLAERACAKPTIKS